MIKDLDNIGNVSITKLIKKYGTPAYIYDYNMIEESYNKIYDAFYSKYNNFKLCYSTKVNNNLAILKILYNLGSGFDCSSKGEIYLINKLGDDKFIGYNGNYNNIDELRFSIKNKVNLIILDDISLINKLKIIKPNVDIIYGFRINYNMSLIKGISLSGNDSKFGISEKEIIIAYKKLKSLGIKKFAIHAMLGSNMLNFNYFELITEMLMKSIIKIKKILKIDVNYIDIGGGFGISYNNTKDLDINRTAKKVTDTIYKYVKLNNLKLPTLIIEPGRFILGHSGYLIGKVDLIKKRNNKIFIGTDISINSILRIPLFKAKHNISIFRNNKTKKQEKVNICGKICWDGDIWLKNIKIPKVNINDIIILHDVGAYGYIHSNQFNTRQKPCEVLIFKNKSYLIRERDRLSEFDRLVILPKFLK